MSSFITTVFADKREETSGNSPVAATAVTIGAQNEFEATLPLTPAEDFVATEQQRARIVRMALDELLAEDPTNRIRGWGRLGMLREEIKRRTGVNDAAAMLMLYASRGELGGSDS